METKPRSHRGVSAPPTTPHAPPAGFLARVRFNTTATDLFLLLSLVFWVARLWATPTSAERAGSLPIYGGALLAFVAAWLSMRGAHRQPGVWRSLGFRMVLFSSIDIPFMFGLRKALAALQTELLDAELMAIDRALFGEVPSVMMEPWLHPVAVEWLAFFYFSYFALVAGAIIPAVVKGRDAVRNERLYGILFISVLGNIIYTFVPGRGPFAAMTFSTPIEGGLFWGLVEEMVSMIGPQLDIFPSLHTAVPVFLAIHTFRNRTSRLLKWLAWPLVFTAVNIVIATMYLRWHYAVDVIAGLVFALAAVAFASWARRTEARRVAAGRQPTFGTPLPESAGD